MSLLWQLPKVLSGSVSDVPSFLRKQESRSLFPRKRESGSLDSRFHGKILDSRVRGNDGG